MVERLVCRYKGCGCGKACKSRADLTMHQKQMNRVTEARVRFKCTTCGISWKLRVGTAETRKK